MFDDELFARRDLPGREPVYLARAKPFGDLSHDSTDDDPPEPVEDREDDDADAIGGETDAESDTPERDIPSSWPAERPTIRIRQEAFCKVMWTLGRGQFRCEEAGLLVGPVDSDLITDFVEDQHGRSTTASFTLNGKRLTRIVRQLKSRGVEVKGIAHSHPDGVTKPSGGDLHYLSRLFNNPKNDGADHIIFPIICRQRLWPYIVTPAGEVYTAELVLV